MALHELGKVLTGGPDCDVLSSVRLGNGWERHGGLAAVVHMARVNGAWVVTNHLVDKNKLAMD